MIYLHDTLQPTSTAPYFWSWFIDRYSDSIGHNMEYRRVSSCMTERDILIHSINPNTISRNSQLRGCQSISYIDNQIFDPDNINEAINQKGISTANFTYTMTGPCLSGFNSFNCFAQQKIATQDTIGIAKTKFPFIDFGMQKVYTYFQQHPLYTGNEKLLYNIINDNEKNENGKKESNFLLIIQERPTSSVIVHKSVATLSTAMYSHKEVMDFIRDIMCVTNYLIINERPIISLEEEKPINHSAYLEIAKAINPSIMLLKDLYNSATKPSATKPSATKPSATKPSAPPKHDELGLHWDNFFTRAGIEFNQPSPSNTE